jgi:hypothetical protein
MDVMKKEYHVTIYSTSRFCIAGAIFLCSFTVFFKDNFPKQEGFFSFLLFIGMLIPSLLLARLVSIATIKVVFTQEAFFHIWKRKFVLSWEKDIEIPWTIVDKCYFESFRTLDSIVVNLKNKTKYKISRQNFFPDNDDFGKLAEDFPKFIKSISTNNAEKK